MFKQLLRGVCFGADYSKWLAAAGSDALQAPTPRGPARARTIDPAIKAAAVEAASKGELGVRSGAAVARHMGRSRKSDLGRIAGARPKGLRSRRPGGGRPWAAREGGPLAPAPAG